MSYKVNGIALNVLERNDAPLDKNRPALVFLHYFGGSSRAWSGVVEQLANEYRCLALDLRGFGDSAAPPTGYAVNDSASDVAALIEILQLDHYALVGHSMGGKIALHFAAQQPRGLVSLVLLAPSPPTPEPMSDTERARLLETHGSRRAAIETIDKITARPLLAATLVQAIEDNLRSSGAAWRAWLESGSREDISAEASNVNAPVLVVAGECDQAMTKELLEREVVRRISTAHLTALPRVAHLLPLEAPAEVAELIRSAATNQAAK